MTDAESRGKKTDSFNGCAWPRDPRGVEERGGRMRGRVFREIQGKWRLDSDWPGVVCSSMRMGLAQVAEAVAPSLRLGARVRSLEIPDGEIVA